MRKHDYALGHVKSTSNQNKPLTGRTSWILRVHENGTVSIQKGLDFKEENKTIYALHRSTRVENQLRATI